MNFIKMQSLGNDFVIIENQAQPINIKAICDRKFGIGCDQLIIVNKIFSGLELQIFNQDGSIANMCGNGVRCVAGRYFDQNPDKNELLITILPKKQIFIATKIQNSLVKIAFSRPIVNQDLIDVGNLHKIINLKTTVNDYDILDSIDKQLNTEDKTPNSTFNKNYISIQNNTIYLITIERGVGETLACGSGSIASGIFCIKNNLIKSPAKIINKGSIIDQTDIYVEYNESQQIAFLIGGYKYVFFGTI